MTTPTDPDLTLAYAVLDRAQATQAQQHGEPLTGPAQRGVLAVVFGWDFADRFPIPFTKGY